MNKKIEPAHKTENDAFFWMRDPDFVPPLRGCDLDACAKKEISDLRITDLCMLLNTFLEAATGLTKAKAAIVRTLLPDETLQVISSIGLSKKKPEAIHRMKLACENCDKDAFQNGMCATDIKFCEVRANDHLHHEFLSVISIPLKNHHSSESPLGIFTLFFDTPQTSSGKATNMAATLATLMGSLIEHILSSREVKRAELLMERQSIANEIHDSLAQTLNYARMNTTLLGDAVRHNNEVMATKYLCNIEESLEISQKAVRSLITDFRSEMDPAGLLHALQTLTEKFRQQYDITLDCSIRVADLDLPLEYEIQTYHIVHEALSNIAKHSNSSHARLIVDHLCGYYVFTVEDNGIGTFSQVEGHYGIAIMRERAHRIGGEIKATSAKGLGTCIQLFFPEPEVNWRRLDD